MIGRRDKDLARDDRSFLLGLGRRQLRSPGDQGGQLARVMGVEVLDDHDGGREIAWEGAQDKGQRSQSACRRGEGDHVEITSLRIRFSSHWLPPSSWRLIVLPLKARKALTLEFQRP